MARFNFFLTLFILFFQLDYYCQVYPDKDVDSLMNKGISEIITQKYSDAENDFEDLNKQFPQLPFGKIYLAATSITRSYDLGLDFNSDYIEKLLKSATEDSELLIKKDKNNIWNYYFNALSNGYFAYYLALTKNWLPAINRSLNSISAFETCLNMNPKFYDSYTAIGSFKYWKSRKTEFLDWLPFVKNEEKKGIHYLIIAVNHFSYNRYLAVNSLIWIYIDRKEFGKAINLCSEALKKYPDSRTFQWGLARAYEGIDLRKSIEIYSSLLKSYISMPENNGYNEIVLKHILAQQYYKLGEKAKALYLCKDILNTKNISESVKERLRSRFNRVKKLETDISE